MKTKITVTLIFMACTFHLHAQVPARLASQAVTSKSRSLAQNLSHLAAKDFPALYATEGGALHTALTRQLVAAQTQTIALPSTAATLRPQRSWLEQQRRDYQARRLKRLHTKKLDLPQLLAGKSFYVSGFESILADAATSPALPFLEEPGYLYRGLALEADGHALANILTNGLRVEDAGRYSNKLMLALTSTPEDAACASSSTYTNLTNSPNEALRYTVKNHKRSPDKVLPVIVKVTGEAEDARVVRVQHDIPTQNIPEVIVLVNADGAPTWCRVTMENDAFRLVPYEVK